MSISIFVASILKLKRKRSPISGAPTLPVTLSVLRDEQRTISVEFKLGEDRSRTSRCCGRMNFGESFVADDASLT